MQYRNLGSTDIKLSAIGLGTVKFGRNTKVKYPKSFELPTKDEMMGLLGLAKDLGVNYLDTAPAYNSEEILGELLAKDRHDWILGTKVGEEFKNNESFYCYTKEHIDYSIWRSLKNLKTDYLDMVLVHSNGDDEYIISTGIFEELEKLKQKGIIRSFGMSTKTIKGGKAALDKSDVIMSTYNLDEQTEKELIDYANQKNKGILIKKGFASGHLVNQSNKEEMIKKSFELIFEHEAVSSLIIGTINPIHLKQNISILNKLNVFNII